MLKILGLIVEIRWFYIDVLMLRLDPHDMSIMGGLCGRKINKPIGGIVCVNWFYYWFIWAFLR